MSALWFIVVRMTVVGLILLISRTKSANLDETLILTLGVVKGPCTGECDNETMIKSVAGMSDIIAAKVIWTEIDINEAFLVLSTVNAMNTDRIVDLIILSEAMPYGLDYSLLPFIDVPILQWTPPLTSPDLQNGDIISLDTCDTGPTFVVTDTKSITKAQEAKKGCEDQLQNTDIQYTNTKTHHEVYNSTTHVLVNIVASLALRLKWTSTFILTDLANEDKLGILTEGLSRSGVWVVDDVIPDIQSEHFERNFLSMLDYAIEELPNITLVCSMECVSTILRKPFHIERREVQRYAMRHMTRWLIVTFGDKMAAENLTNLKTNLDNVVVIVLPESVLTKSVFHGPQEMQSHIQAVLNDVGKSFNSSETSNNSTLKSLAVETLLSYNHTTCQWVTIETLMWTKTGRVFQTVGHIRTSGKLLTSSDIFPNVNFGFNGRELLVSTNVWYPFVGKNNNMTFYGFCIDLLEHLAESLNFTYRMTMPADGAWGMELDNGNFNGLVGQMQRNEVDLILAPLSTQRNREVVMDFSYPFYLEPTKLLLKKPDPSDKKWRTLIDPFTPTVLLCIGISLPTMSFILCLLESLSPFYSGIEDRSSMRGLHHFSDSFWYLYGALLTQGGEHMSDSISGRTLLSFWWLFCIAMMATYSGNLIAFLTITKDKPPFDTLSGMVNQEVYSWGTIGGSAFVDILKTSQQHTYQQVWKGIVRFNKTDINVLSGNPNIHVEKVLGGNYAYLGDKTYNEITMRTRTECDLVMTKEEFLPLQYAVGLPNNSPFTKIFSELIISVHESGLRQIWKIKHWPKRNVCYSPLVPPPTAVSLIDLQSAFYLIGLGFILAWMILVCECARARCKASKQ